MRKNAINIGVFLLLAGALFFLWRQADEWFPQPEKKDETKEVVNDPKQKDEQAKKEKEKEKESKQPEGPKEPPKVEPPTPIEPPTLIALGGDNFYTRALLSTKGGGVQQVVLPRFEEADRLGRPAKDAAGNPVPFYIIPGVPQVRSPHLREDFAVPALTPGKVNDHSSLAEPCYTIFHYPTPDDKHPDTKLGEINWKVIPEERPTDGEQKVVFEAELGDPYFVKFRKTYTLGPKDYHISLKIEIEKQTVPGAAKDKGKLRYQLSGPRGLPIEGEWYATIYRNAVIGWLDANGTPRRQLEDASNIGLKRGGDAVVRGDNTFKYMGVATQYFASAVAIDDKAKDEGASEHPWAYVRATTELPFDKKQDQNMPQFDDITVRAASETLNLEPGQKVTHSFVIYNGPSKVRLLQLMPEKQGAVDVGLVDRYKNNLSLQTITDFRSDTWIGRFANFIYWTDLVIVFTNLMHWLLAEIHGVTDSWVLSIVILTVFVRLLLMYPSRKQTAMQMRMTEVQKKLQPEFDKLHEKYKDDPGTYNSEKTKLMMRNGANPFAAMGGCLMMLAQMPIMMGLYYCLQESVFFRLESFLWINNLAAPDMLIWWTEDIPWISETSNIGSMLYLGPYFNLLPVLAVSLMMYQQSKAMPKATDPEAQKQQQMMKIMMVMMAVFFYKVAAGLALYFIVSTSWGIIERQFIPKPKINIDNVGGGGSGGGGPSGGGAGGGPSNGKPPSDAEQKNKGLLGRLREAMQKRLEEMQKAADEQSRRQIINEKGDKKKKRKK